MNIFVGIRNFLEIVNENWTSILIIISLLVAIYKKTKDYFNQSNSEKVEVAKAQITEIILKLISDAEIDYETWNKAGSIKRSQVIKQIYTDYPILSKVIDQEAIIAWIDETIDNSLKTLRKIVSENQAKDDSESNDIIKGE